MPGGTLQGDFGRRAGAEQTIKFPRATEGRRDAGRLLIEAFARLP